MTRKALATLVVGARYAELFEQLCRPNWERYAAKYGYDIVVFDRPLDTSERARGRSVAWQKCLVFDQPETRDYDQVVWVDSDILINVDHAPSIADQVPADRIGAVDCYAAPSVEICRAQHELLYAHWRSQGIEFVDNLTPEAFYTNFGLPPGLDMVAQTGVLVVSPSVHAEVFRYVYDTYEDRGGAEWNYEMRPLSYEIVRRGLVDWIDGRFNQVWDFEKLFRYPFLANMRPAQRRLFGAVGRRLGVTLPAARRARAIQRACATSAFLNSYFLHFAGNADEMNLVDTEARSVFEVVVD